MTLFCLKASRGLVVPVRFGMKKNRSAEPVPVAKELVSSQAEVTPDAEPGDSAGTIPKYRAIFRELKEAIVSGTLRPGDRLQTEAELGVRYQASRITVAKAVNELMRQGLVSRRAGSGTHVLESPETQGHVFGLLIPDLGRTEIFEPICQGMMRSPLAKPHSLLWGHAMAEAEQQGKEARELCRHYIHQKVSGVFFAPLEFSPGMGVVNREIADALQQANMPMVLLDRCYAPYPLRSNHDLVGIDNRATGYIITDHLLALGRKRPVFLARARSASTVYGRLAGFREALEARGLHFGWERSREGDTGDRRFVKQVIEELRPDSFVCSNDVTAGRLIATLTELGLEVPREFAVVGVDDVKHAGLFSVPLTTQHQNCADIGATAMAVMLQRLAQPQLPTRDVLLKTYTVVRESCGARLKGHSDVAA